MSVARPHELRPPGLALLLTLLTGMLALTFVGAAQAATIGEKIILRCTHGESLSGFSQRAYQQALSELSGDSEEYSGCAQEIREAERAGAQHGHAGGPAATGTTAPPLALAAAPGELRSLAHARNKAGAVSVGGQVIHPGVVHTSVASALSTLPAPLLAVLALLIACALLFATVFIRRRVRSRHEH